MPIQATFTADFTKWDAALKNAQANLRTFEVSTKNVQQSLQRMTSGFDGTKIMREAKTVVAAVEAIGGASRLTAAEQKKVNATVEEAIAKYKALGQVAPKEMRDLANATKGVVAPTNAATSSVASLVATYVTVGAAVALATKGISALTDFLQDSIRAYAGAEAAQNRMVAALRAQGTATPTVIKQYAELASTIQRTTAFSDDAANEMQALFISIGNVGPAQMEKATTAATDLAAGLGIDLTQAATLVSKALAGNTGALGRYGIKITEAKVAAEGASAVFGAINDRFGGQAAAQLDTYAGKLDQLANNWDNVQEAIGKTLVTNEIATFAMNRLAAALNDASEASEDAGSTIAVAFMGISAPVAGAIALLEDYLALLNDIDRMSRGIKAPSAVIAAPLPNLTGEGLVEWDRQNEALDEARKKAEAAQKAIRDLASEVSGAKMLGSITQLEKAWRSLSAAERADPVVQGRVIDKFLEMEAAVGDLPPQLQAFRVELTKVSATAKSLTFDKSVKSFQQFTKEIQKTERANYLEKMAADAAKLDQAILSNLSVTLKANAEYDKTLREEGLSRTSFLISEVQRWEREEKATIDKSVLNWKDAFDATERVASQRINTILTESQELALVFTNLGTLTGGMFGPVFIQNAENARKTIEALGLEAEKTGQTFGSRLGRNLATNLDEALGNIPAIITDALIHGATFEQTAAAIGTQIGSAMGGAIGSALTGGSALGGKIGAALGGLLGPLLDALIKTRAEKTQERIREEYGVAISEGLAQAIEDAADQFGGDRQAAKLFNLDRIIAEGGGLSSANVDIMLARLREVFSAIETGAFTTEEAMDVLDKNFAEFAAFVTRDGALASQALLDIIELNERFGTSSAAVAEFVTSQVTSAIGGLTTFLENAEVTSQAAAEGIAASVFGAFEALTAQGASPLEAIRQITPVLEQLDAQMQAAGFSGGAAFEHLRALAALAADEVKGPMIEAITGLGTALEGLHNSGVLNQEMFAGLSTQITDTYNKLIAQGTDAGHALALVGESVQTLWELQEDFGYAVDEATQKLIDQGVAAGVVGDEHRSAQEQMAEAMDRTADAVEYLAEQFGYVAEEAKKSADAINKIPDKVNIRVNYDVERLPDAGFGGEAPERSSGYNERYARGYAKGGVVYAAQGMWAPRGTDTVPAMLTPGEVVLPRDVVASLRSSPSSAPVTVHLTIQTLDGADVERVVRSPSFRQALTSAVSGNVGGVRTDLRTAIGVR